jgi:UDP-N-acetylglucosamine transferase subunit ALG13
MEDRPLVAVYLGTDHHPFDRVVAWVSGLAAEGRWRWFVQHGSTRLPLGLEGDRMLTLSRLNETMREAGAVVTHGGPGLIMEARAAGHRPIVVPRRAELGEHVDGHQVRFCARAAGAGLITLVDSRDQLRAAVAEAMSTGGRATTDAGGNAATVLRFSQLVDDLVRRRV